MIFEDFSQKRWKKAKLVFAGIFLILLVLLGGTIVSLIVNPPLASVQERQDNIKKAAHIKANILANDKKTVRPINSPATNKINRNRRRATSKIRLQPPRPQL